MSRPNYPPEFKSEAVKQVLERDVAPFPGRF
jgi:transposase-like protein